MRIDTFSNLGKPRLARFNEFGDRCSGVIVIEPEWVEDTYDPEEQMLKVVVQDDRNIYWLIRVRSAMRDAVFDALLAADTEEIAIGGRLTVEHTEVHGQVKIYKAWYEPPPAGSDSEAPF